MDSFLTRRKKLVIISNVLGESLDPRLLGKILTDVFFANGGITWDAQGFRRTDCFRLCRF